MQPATETRPVSVVRISMGAFALAALIPAFGCSTVTPASFRAKAPDVAVSWPGPVSVTVSYRENPESRFNANGMIFRADLDDFSGQLAGLVVESLKKAGLSIGGGGKSMEIQVVYLDFMFQGPCILDYTVTLGNGEAFGQQTTGASRLFDRACTKALEDAVKQILGDPRTAGYFGAP